MVIPDASLGRFESADAERMYREGTGRLGERKVGVEDCELFDGKNRDLNVSARSGSGWKSTRVIPLLAGNDPITHWKLEHR